MISAGESGTLSACSSNSKCAHLSGYGAVAATVLIAGLGRQPTAEDVRGAYCKGATQVSPSFSRQGCRGQANVRLWRPPQTMAIGTRWFPSSRRPIEPESPSLANGG